MNIFKRLAASWKAQTTLEKIDTIIDIITMVGSSIAGTSVAKKLGEGHNIASRACINLTCSGLSLAAGDIAAKQLKENYGKPLAMIIDHAKSKKEDKANG